MHRRLGASSSILRPDMTTEFSDTVELLQHAELSEVVVHEERARRVKWTDEEKSAGIPPPILQMAVSLTANRIRYRFRLVLADAHAEYVADFETVYIVGDAEEIAPTDDVQKDFGERVALMATYSHLRASIFGAAGRLGTPRPILPMLRLGQLSLEPDDSGPSASEVFGEARSELVQREKQSGG